MNAQSRVVLLTLAGIIAGALTWMIVDLSGLIRLPDHVGQLTRAEVQSQFNASMVYGGFLGLCLGCVGGAASGSAGHLWRAGLIGLLVGVSAGAGGIGWAMGIFGFLYTENATNPVAFLGNVLARAMGWALIGAFVGTTEGWRKRSFRVGRNGFIGGLIGGALGGMVFEITPYLFPGLPRSGVLSRLFGFTITGGAIGFFVGLVQQLLKEAWIRVVVGRNEGKEFLLDQAEMRIGRDELADIPLFGDPNIGKTHAVLTAQQGGGFALRDGGSPAGTRVNGRPVADAAPLRDGDRIEIAGRTLIYHERAASGRRESQPRDVAPAEPAVAGASALADALPAPGTAPSPLRSAATATHPAPSPTTAGTAQFHALSGPHTGTSWALGAECAIGRDAGNDIPLTGDTKASRVHARVRREGNTYVLEDAGSTNGTYVNGLRVSGRQPLVPGDTVLVGTTALRLDNPPAGRG